MVGFIGPEYLYDARQITRAGLEDHFMGKLHGISMGCDACYTNHADADQNDLENLEVLLTTAGCNFFMGLPMGDDVMLNYQSTSFHDGAALRQLFGFRPAPEFEAWLEEMGIMRDGKLTAARRRRELVLVGDFPLSRYAGRGDRVAVRFAGVTEAVRPRPAKWGGGGAAERRYASGCVSRMRETRSSVDSVAARLAPSSSDDARARLSAWSASTASSMVPRATRRMTVTGFC